MFDEMEKVAEQLSEILTKEFEYLEKDLNKWVVKREFQLEPGMEEYEKTMGVTIHLDERVAQKLPLDPNIAFNLNQPIAGSIKNIPTDRESPIIIRSLIGYTMATRLLTKPDSLKYLLFQNIEIIKKLKGYDQNQIVFGECFASFKFNTDKFFVRDVPNTAAFELRCYSNCTKCKVI
jgi:hypothetical protein